MAFDDKDNNLADKVLLGRVLYDDIEFTQNILEFVNYDMVASVAAASLTDGFFLVYLSSAPI